MHPFEEYVNPILGKLIRQLKMDKRFVRAEGHTLYDEKGQAVLDFLAAYGALPFGHNPPEIWDALIKAQGEPNFVQPSSLEAAGELARKLVELTPGMRYCTFANSGAEAVEAALKLARAATKRLGILSAKNSFHGKTLGALSATGRAKYQKGFGAPAEGFETVAFGDLEALEQKLAEKPEYYAALILEPIQGEGGIVVPPPGYLRGAKEICQKYGTLLIFDEIQSGLGRTGYLYAHQTEEVTPDLITIAKALGGGLMPIGAVLCTEAVYSEDFGDRHSSTFAGNTLACRVGLASVELLTRDDQALIKQVSDNGKRLFEKLRELQKRHPKTLREVRGRGYLLGLEFSGDREDYPSNLLRILCDQELLTPAISSYLLNRHFIRVAPTLNGAQVIRIEPPLIVTWDACEKLLEALEETFTLLESGKSLPLIYHLIGDEDVPEAPSAPVSSMCAPRPEDGRFAFLVHPLTPQSYVEFDESLGVLPSEKLEKFAEICPDILEPFVVSTTRIVSETGKTAYGEFISVPYTTEQLMALPGSEAKDAVKKAVALAKSRGAQLVGLGAYTSVVTRGGLYLRGSGVAITTGNSYTVVAAFQAIEEAERRLGLDLKESTVAIVGATGSIGRALAMLLAGQTARLVLLGNPDHPAQSLLRLERILDEIREHNPDAEIILSTDREKYLPQADVVVAATSSLQALMTSENLKFGAVVCDLSRPPNASRELMSQRPDVLVIDGGVIAAPGTPNLGWNFGFEQGQAYACMAETMILALGKHFEDTSLGSDLNRATIKDLQKKGAKLGFKLAQFRSFDRPLPQDQWQRTLAARSTHVPTTGV